jgi:hypothetical protein
MFTIRVADGTEETADMLPEAVDILEDLDQAGIIVWDETLAVMARQSDGLWRSLEPTEEDFPVT